MLFALLFAACDLPACDKLCTERAACVAATIAEQGSTWEEWTGFADEQAYSDACFATFAEARDDGASGTNALCADERREQAEIGECPG